MFGRGPDGAQQVNGQTVGGTGVGLTIAKRIVEAHRGSLSVESTPGRGSCFTVRLPAPPGEDAAR
jgi:signal transduction histidine kinase